MGFFCLDAGVALGCGFGLSSFSDWPQFAAPLVLMKLAATVAATATLFCTMRHAAAPRAAKNCAPMRGCSSPLYGCGLWAAESILGSGPQTLRDPNAASVAAHYGLPEWAAPALRILMEGAF